MIEKERSNMDANIESHEEISSSTVLMERREKNSTKWLAFIDVNAPKSPGRFLGCGYLYCAIFVSAHH